MGRKRAGKKLVQLWFKEDKWRQIKAAAESVDEPITGWIKRTVFGALRRWELPEASILYEPCGICGKKHNEQEHFKGD